MACLLVASNSGFHIFKGNGENSDDSMKKNLNNVVRRSWAV